MDVNIFEFDNYKKYLNAKISSMPVNGRGVKKKLADHIDCDPTYVSSVLNEKADFSLEQGIKVNEFFGHSKNQAKFFICQIEYARAGNHELKDHFFSQLRDMKKLYIIFPEVENEKLPDDRIKKYFSNWYISAIHVLIQIEEYRTYENICKLIDLPKDQVAQVLEFLIESELISYDGKKYTYIAKDVLWQDKCPASYHISWRGVALRDIKNFGKSKNKILGSLIVPMSRETEKKVVQIFSDAIREAYSLARSDEKKEVVKAIVLDYFTFYDEITEEK